MTQTRSKKTAKKFKKCAGRCIAPATFTVTVALEEVRKRKYLSKNDVQHMSQAEYNSYLDLADREWGVTQWEPEKN